MKLNELTYPRAAIKDSGKYEHLTVLKDLGFSCSGLGSFGCVFTHPKLNYVLKLFHAKDHCYVKFYNMAIQHQDNPHFPNFRGKMMRVTNNAYAVRMEKLSESAPNATHIVGEIVNIMSGRDLGADITEDFPMLKGACELVKDNMSGCENDLYESNIMWRGNIPVITDPYYDPKTL